MKLTISQLAATEIARAGATAEAIDYISANEAAIIEAAAHGTWDGIVGGVALVGWVSRGSTHISVSDGWLKERDRAEAAAAKRAEIHFR